MVGLGLGPIPLWSGTGHIWPIGRRMPLAIINIKENGMDIIKGILVGVVLALLVKYAIIGASADDFSEYKSTDSFSQFK